MNFEVQTEISQIRNVILVSSGKGGVGKSTVAANLAASLHAQGHSVAVLDADIQGPSQNLMWGIPDDQLLGVSEDGMHTLPIIAHGVAVVSMASRIPANQAASWRGPMITMALLNLIFHTQWGQRDYLVVDMPPGTGDVQISICDKLPNAGVIIVTTPQPVALIDCRKGLQMYLDKHMRVLGVVENMSAHVCSHCGHADPVFGTHGGAGLAEEYQLPLLAQIPLQTVIRSQADLGQPLVLAQSDHALAGIYVSMLEKIGAVSP